MKTYGTALRPVVLAATLLILTACVTTSQPRTAVEEKAAQFVAKVCRLTWRGDGGVMRSDEKIDTSKLTITSVRKDAAGWVRISFAHDGFIDNAYMSLRKDMGICSSAAWTDRFPPFKPVPDPVTLDDLGGPAQASAAPPKPPVHTPKPGKP